MKMIGMRRVMFRNTLEHTTQKKNVGNVEYNCGGSKGECDWYSHNDLLEICENDHKLCDRLFQEIDWSYPETWLAEYDEEETT